MESQLNSIKDGVTHLQSCFENMRIVEKDMREVNEKFDKLILLVSKLEKLQREAHIYQ